jgi:hypothetical protein
VDYPGNFEIPVFPAGKRIAISRLMAVCTFVAFFAVVFLCGILYWASRSESMSPFMIFADADNGEWRLVGRSDSAQDYSVEYAMQESLINNFIKDWFRISSAPVANQIAWQRCDRETCSSGDGLMFGSIRCSIYCSVSDEMFSRFSIDVLPGYATRADSGISWIVNDKDLTVLPAGAVGPVGGFWRARATISVGADEDFTVVAFVKVARNSALYPKTMGYYIADFNSYRID